MAIYRRIWVKHHGPIPLDECGRSYEIHHIDGNNKNNEITNLKCVTIEEHYKIHYEQKDWGACSAIAKRMSYMLTSKELSEIAKKAVEKQKIEGKHNLNNPELRKIYIKKQIDNKTHPFYNSELQRKNGIKGAMKTFKLRQSRMIHDNPNKTILTCPHCSKSGAKPAMIRHHFDNCKFKKP